MTCYVQLFEEKIDDFKKKKGDFKELDILAAGTFAVINLTYAARDGIPEAEYIEFAQNCNVDICFKGEGADKFIKRVYPDEHIDIDPEKEYRISAFDFS